MVCGLLWSDAVGWWMEDGRRKSESAAGGRVYQTPFLLLHQGMCTRVSHAKEEGTNKDSSNRRQERHKSITEGSCLHMSNLDMALLRLTSCFRSNGHAAADIIADSIAIARSERRNMHAGVGGDLGSAPCTADRSSLLQGAVVCAQVADRDSPHFGTLLGEFVRAG